MSYLIDTNVLSELRKRGRCDRHVTAWYRRVRQEDLFLSVLLIGELRLGAERVRHKDGRQFTALDRWLILAIDRFADRIIPVDRLVAEEWGRIGADAQVSVIDGLLAATAKMRRLTMITRNVPDFAATGVQVLNPFEPLS